MPDSQRESHVYITHSLPQPLEDPFINKLDINEHVPPCNASQKISWPNPENIINL